MNKKGFTLIELLGAIVIMGLLITLASIAVVSIIGRSRDKAMESAKNNLLDAAVVYATEKKMNLTRCADMNNVAACASDTITVKKLIDENYFEDEADNCYTDREIKIYRDTNYAYHAKVADDVCTKGK